MGVQSSIEDVNEVTKRAKVSIPAERVSKELGEALDKLTRKSSLKGFRAGKAPRHLIEKLHGEQVRREVTGRLVSAAVQELISESKLEVVGVPEIEDLSYEPGADVTFTASLSLFPSPQITGYSKFKVQVPKREIGDAEVDEVLFGLRKSKAVVRKVEGRQLLEAADVIDALVEVKIEGESSSRPEPVVIGLGEGQLPEAVEKGLIGLEVGQRREIETTISSERVDPKLRGRKAVYAVELRGISEKILPEADDAFVKSLESDVKTMLELKLDIRKRLEAEQERIARDNAKERVLEQLLSSNPFIVPQVLLDEEIRTMLVRGGLLDPSKIDPSRVPVEAFREKFNAMAEKRVKISVVVDTICANENLKATKEDLDGYVAEVAKESGLGIEEVHKYLLGSERKLGTTLEVTRNKVLDFLLQRTEIEYVAPAVAESGGSAAES